VTVPILLFVRICPAALEINATVYIVFESVFTEDMKCVASHELFVDCKSDEHAFHKTIPVRCPHAWAREGPIAALIGTKSTSMQCYIIHSTFNAIIHHSFLTVCVNITINDITNCELTVIITV